MSNVLIKKREVLLNKLMMILPLAMILCLMVGCQNKEAMAELEEFRAQAEVEEQNKAKVIRFFKEVDKKNFDAYDEIFAEKFVGHFPPLPDINSLEVAKQSIKEDFEVMPDYTHTIEDIIARDDKVVVRLTNSGTDKTFDKKITFPVVLILKFADGKVIETWGMVDFLGQAWQRGKELRPKEEK